MKDKEDYYHSLVNELIQLPRETEWIEFKHNNANPEEIGEYISALSNSAALMGKTNGYLLWGINNRDHSVIGTNFKPKRERKGAEELESWLLKLLTPKIDFAFYEISFQEKPVVLLEFRRATTHPVQFQGIEYIRIGSYKKRLKDFPDKERALWRIFDKAPFEALAAKDRLDSDEILKFLSYPNYFDLLKLPLPDNKAGIISRLEEDKMIRKEVSGQWSITNLGAILFAKNLDDFFTLKRKAVRVIIYRGKSRIETQKEQMGTKGYAIGFEGLIEYVRNFIPGNEIIEKALRELTANALIH